MPSVRFAAPGTDAVAFAPFAVTATLLKVAIGSPPAVHVAFAQTWKVTEPVSFASGSSNVAVRPGVAVLMRWPSFGVTSVAASGERFAALFVTTIPLAVAAGLPVASAVSRTIGSLPGFV